MHARFRGLWVRYLLHVSKTAQPTWPEYLLALMADQGIGAKADFARLVGVNESVVSRWLSGQSQPSVSHLRAVARRTGARLPHLLVVAGHVEAEELDLEPVVELPSRHGEVDVRSAILGSSLDERDKRLLLAQYEAMQESA